MTDIAMITGAGGSIGRATAARLARDGYVVLCADVDVDGLHETERVVRANGGTPSIRAVDLHDPPAIEAWFAEADGLGDVRVMVNNAAVYPSMPFLEIPIATYDDVQAVNQRGHWLCAQEAARRMRGRGGSIVNLASITMHGGWSDLSAYVATKGALAALTRAWARELGPDGIRVNAVSPGAFPTAAERIHPDPQAYDAHVIAQQSLKRRGDPAEVASVISFLVGADASFVTGQTLEVNGGWVMS